MSMNVVNHQEDSTTGKLVRQKSVDGAGLISDPWQVPRTTVIPEVGGSPQSAQIFGDGANDIQYLMLTFNAITDAIAAQRFVSGYPDIAIINPGDLGAYLSDTELTTVHIVAIGDTTSGTLAAGELVTSGETLANFQTALVRFDFNAGEAVKSLTIATTDRYATVGTPATTANYSRAFVQGYSHE